MKKGVSGICFVIILMSSQISNEFCRRRNVTTPVDFFRFSVGMLAWRCMGAGYRSSPATNPSDVTCGFAAKVSEVVRGCA